MNDDKKILIEIGNRISRRRRELHLTQAQVAEAMNISLQSISCIELGKKAIRPVNLINLCRVLDISADYILTGNNAPQPIDDIANKLTRLNAEDYKLIEHLIELLYKKA